VYMFHLCQRNNDCHYTNLPGHQRQFQKEHIPLYEKAEILDVYLGIQTFALWNKCRGIDILFFGSCMHEMSIRVRVFMS